LGGADQVDDDDADDDQPINGPMTSGQDVLFRDAQFEDEDGSDAEWDPGDDSGAEDATADAEAEQAEATAASPMVDADDLLAILAPFTESKGNFKWPAVKHQRAVKGAAAEAGRPEVKARDAIEARDAGSQDVIWTYHGQSDAVLKVASLPWSFTDPDVMASESDDEDINGMPDPTETPAFNPNFDAMPPSIRPTKFADKFDLGAKVRELEQFLVFYPGGVDGMLKHVDRVNEIASQHEVGMNHRRGWPPIDIWDWLAF
jgi:hypothetical protein